MFPGLPSCLNPAIRITSTVDEECQANIVTRFGRPVGVWLDDTTPMLMHWLGLAVEKYGPLGQTVFVCVPPGDPHLRHKPSPPVVNVQEWYPYGMGCAPSLWGPPPDCEAFCIQWRYPGTHGAKPPTLRQRLGLLRLVRAHRPQFIFLF